MRARTTAVATGPATGRRHHGAPFIRGLAATLGKPVTPEEFGPFSGFADDDHAAEDTRRPYAELGEVAGAEASVTSDDPRVTAGALQHEDGPAFVVLVSHGATEMSVRPHARKGILTDLVSGERIGGVGLESYGLRVLPLPPSEEVR